MIKLENILRVLGEFNEVTHDCVIMELFGREYRVASLDSLIREGSWLDERVRARQQGSCVSSRDSIACPFFQFAKSDSRISAR